MRGLGRFLCDEKGAVTVEFTVLVPIFVLLLVFFADASVIWLTHSEMYNTARDVSRRMSTREITTTDEVLTHASSRLLLGTRNYTITPEFGSESRVTIMLPVHEAAIFGTWFRPILGRYLIATAETRREPRIAAAE